MFNLLFTLSLIVYFFKQVVSDFRFVIASKITSHSLACNLHGLKPTATNVNLADNAIWNHGQANAAISAISTASLTYVGRKGCCACTLICEQDKCFSLGYGCKQYQNLGGTMAYQALTSHSPSAKLVFTCSTDSVAVNVPVSPSSTPEVLGVIHNRDNKIHLYGNYFGNNQNVLNVFLGQQGATDTKYQCTDIQICHGYCTTCTSRLDCLSSSDLCIKNVCLPKCSNKQMFPCGLSCGLETNSNLPVCVPSDYSISTTLPNVCTTWTDTRKQFNALHEISCSVPPPEYSVCTDGTNSINSVPIHISVVDVVSSVFEYDMTKFKCSATNQCNDKNACTIDSCFNGCCRYVTLPKCDVGAIVEDFPESISVANMYMMGRKHIDLTSIISMDDKIETMVPGFVTNSIVSSVSSVNDAPTDLIELNFPFLFFEQSARSKIYINANGALQKNSATPCGSGFSSSLTVSGFSCNLYDDYVNMVLPLGCNFNPGSNFQSQIKYVKSLVNGISSVHVFFVSMYPIRDSSNSYTFGSTIQADGTIRFYYIRTRFPILDEQSNLQGIRGKIGSGMDWFIRDDTIKDGSLITFCKMPSVACLSPACGIVGTTVSFQFTASIQCGSHLDTSKFKCEFGGSVTSPATLIGTDSLSCVVPQLALDFFDSETTSTTVNVKIIHLDYDSLSILSLTASELTVFTFTYSNACEGADSLNRCGGIGSTKTCTSCGACSDDEDAFKDCNGICFGENNQRDCFGSCVGNAIIDCRGVCNGTTTAQECLGIAPSPSNVPNPKNPSPSKNSKTINNTNSATKGKVKTKKNRPNQTIVNGNSGKKEPNVDIWIVFGCLGILLLVVLIAQCTRHSVTHNDDSEDYVHRNVVGGLRSNRLGGFPTKHMAAIPTMIFNGDNNDEYGSGDCAICLDLFEQSDLLRKLPCGHRFHSTCIDKWIATNTVCPLCKADIREGLVGVSEDAGAVLRIREFVGVSEDADAVEMVVIVADGDGDREENNVDTLHM